MSGAARPARATALVALAICAAAAGSCASRGSEAAGAADPGPKVTAVLERQVDAWNAGDLETFMDGYWRSPDLVFTSGAEIQRGWQTTLERYQAAYGGSPATMGRLSFSDLEVHPLGPGVAWVLGRWALARERPAGGVFSLVFREIDGRWVIVHDHTSSSGE